MSNRVQRRTFVRNATLGAVGSTLAVVAAGFGGLMWPNKTGAFGSKLIVPADDVPPVDGVPFRNVAGKFYLIHNTDGLMALYTKCPHLGCTVPYVGPADSPHAFQCPCHGSMYDYEGDRTGGPAPRPMDYMTVTVEPDGSVMVNTGEIHTRESYDPSQTVKLA
ncbi:MAG: Rieske (2Fe-2S) protein [Thermomicrobiales bacterium]|nr:Rieske (2Fe-2S) protein [Thermomicrobiales bacterium]